MRGATTVRKFIKLRYEIDKQVQFREFVSFVQTMLLTNQSFRKGRDTYHLVCNINNIIYTQELHHFGASVIFSLVRMNTQPTRNHTTWFAVVFTR
jgi:hypothetical protein